jgi:hypothetical protein
MLTSELVSRRHAVVRVRDGEYVIEDLGSTNGTLLNGEPVTRTHDLRDGDSLTFADVEVEFRLAETYGTPPGQPQPSPEMDWNADQPTVPLGTRQVADGHHLLRGLRHDLHDARGFSASALFLAVLGSVVGASLTSAFGSGQWGTLAGAAVGPVLSTSFSAKRAGEKGRVRNATIVILSVGALLITVTGFSFADQIAGRSILPGADKRPDTFPLPNNHPTTDPIGPTEALDIQVHPQALDCGKVPVGTSASCPGPVTITSTGTEQLHITSVEVTGADAQDFTAGKDCVGKLLDRGNSCEMQVLFRPAIDGQRQATLVIHQNLPLPDRGTEVGLTGAGASDPGTCLEGYVWREAVAGDHVCVTPETRDQTAEDNRLAESRRSPTGGDFGPDTCLEGYVWREAVAGDHVCVTPETRDQTAEDNRLADGRRIG